MGWLKVWLRRSMEVWISLAWHLPSCFLLCCFVGFPSQGSLLHQMPNGTDCATQMHLLSMGVNILTFLGVYKPWFLCASILHLWNVSFSWGQLTACPGFGQVARALSILPAAQVRRDRMLRSSLGSKGLCSIGLPQMLLSTTAAWSYQPILPPNTLGCPRTAAAPLKALTCAGRDTGGVTLLCKFLDAL